MRSRFVSLACMLSFVPIYLSPSSPIPRLAGTPLHPLGTIPGAVHISLVLGPIALVLIALGKRRNPSFQTPKPFVFLGSWLALVAVTAAAVSPNGDTGSLLTLGQLLVPVTFLYIGASVESEEGARSTVKLCAIVLLGYQLLLLGFNVSSLGSLQGAHEISDRFPQYLTYYPGVLALGMVMFGTLWRPRAAPFVAYLAAVVVILPAIWSRLGVLAIIVGLMAAIYLRTAFSSEVKSVKQSVTQMFALILSLGVAAVIASVALSGTLGDRLGSKADPLQSGRFELMREGLSRVLSSPLYGDAGRLLYDRSEFGGMDGQGLRQFPSHSQLIDLGIRGGVIAIVLGMLCAVSLISASRQAMSARKSPMAALLPGVTIVVLFATLSDLYFSQALTAAPTWLLIGIGWRCHLGWRDSRSDSAVGMKSMTSTR